MFNKLDFLMDLTSTRNSVLSKAVSFDPSYISRIRSGKRPLPDSPQFLEQLAAYFARSIRTGVQRTLLAGEVCPGEELPADREELSRLLFQWLNRDPEEDPKAVAAFLQSFSSASSVDPAEAGAAFASMRSPEVIEQIRRRTEELEAAREGEYFYGNEGKRIAVELFLGHLCLQQKPFMLHLFSDEEMSWLYEDPAFSARWARLLFCLLSSGSRIRIPHTVTRNSREMFEAVQKWIPLYMTGAIEPYYLPGIHNGVCRRSLFIAKGESALISSSVEARTEDMLNFLITDKEAVAALEKEYDNYLQLCRPLMHILRGDGTKNYFPSAVRLDAGQGSMYIAQALPSFLTMPLEAAGLLGQPVEDPVFRNYLERTRETFAAQMKEGVNVTEILHLPKEEQILKGEVPFPLGDISHGTPSYVSAEGLILHLRNVVRLLKEEPSYCVVLSDAVPANISLRAREHAGARLVSGMPPTTAFLIEEPLMTTAMYRYLVRIAETAPIRDRDAVTARLEALIKELDHHDHHTYL